MNKNKPLVSIEGGFLELQTSTDYRYDIDVRELETDASREAWLRHLRPKRWFTQEHERQINALLEAAK